MAREFDEEIGAWMEDEDQKKTQPETPESEAAPEVNSIGDSEAAKKEKAENLMVEPGNKGINKKRIIIIGISVAVFLVVMKMIVPTGKTKKQKGELEQAGEVEMPDFGDYKSRSKTETEDIEETKTEVNDVAYTGEVIPKYENKSRKEETKTVYREQAGGNSTSGEEDQDYKNALHAGLGGRTEDLSGTTKNRTATVVNNNVENKDQGVESYLAQKLSGMKSSVEDSGYNTQNMQSNKNEFAENEKQKGGSGYYIGDDTIWPGTIITGVLLQSINSDIPGQIKAQVTQNVYDSMNGKDLLIPQGSTIIAEYNSNLSYNQSRLQVAWKTLIRPDGYYKDLGNMNGTDAQGRSGISGFVDEHLFEYFKAMGIITFFTYINGEFTHSIGMTDNQYAQNLMTANQNAVNQLGENMISRALNIQPSIHISEGKVIKIFVNQSMYFPPVKDYPVTAKYKKEV